MRYVTRLLVLLAGALLITAHLPLNQASKNEPPYLVAVVIVRTGDSKLLTNALRSIENVVDGVVLIHEGSKALSSLAAWRLPGKDQLIKHNLRWTDSFSDARNGALKVAQEAGATWLVLLDDSEQLQQQAPVDNSTVPPLTEVPDLRQLLQKTSELILHCYDEGDRPYTKPRFIKLPAEGWFEGPTQSLFVTESAAPPTSKQLLPGFSFSRQANAEDTELAKRDKELLLKHLAKGPAAARWHCHLGKTLGLLREYTQAGASYQDCARISTDPQEAAWALYQGAINFKAANSKAIAQQMLTQALARHSGMPEAAWLLAFYMYYDRRYQDAADWAAMAESLGCFKGTCAIKGRKGYRELGPWFSGPYDVMRFAYQQLGDTKAAAQAQADHTAAQGAQAAFVEEPVMGLYQASKEERHKYTAKAPEKDAKDEGPKPRVAVLFNTAKRPALFQRTYFSFKQRCLDCNEKVEAWFAVDDRSDPDALADMQTTAPPCEATWIKKEGTGHPKSLNAALDAVTGFDYLVNIEDDWLFTEDEEFITAALDIMDSNPQVGQVLFNKDYREMDRGGEEWKLEGTTHAFVTDKGRRYLIHNHVGVVHSPAHQAYLKTMQPGTLSHFHWPHFSLRPGVWRLSAINAIGRFDEDIGGYALHEEDFALRYAAAGYTSAFLPGVYSVHLAPSKPFRGSGFVDEEDLDYIYASHGLKGVSASSSKSVYALNNVIT